MAVSICFLTVSAMAGVTLAAITTGSVISAPATRAGMSAQPLGGGTPSVLQPCTPRRAYRCRRTPWPSCSATWRRLGFVVSQIREIEDARQKRLERQHVESGFLQR